MSQAFCCVTHFLDRLLPVEYMPEDSECDICQESYTSSEETPVRLPCGHIVGLACITNWLGLQNKNTCHYRCELFPAQGQRALDVDEEDEDEEDDDGDDEDDFMGPEVYYDSDGDLDEFGEILEVLHARDTAHADGCLTRARRERQTYRRLFELGATLPPLSPGHLEELPSSEVDAFFAEIQARGVLNVRALLDIRVTGEVSDRELFDIFRSKGYVWRPRLGRHNTHRGAGASGWSLGNGRFLVSVDNEGYRDQVVMVDE